MTITPIGIASTMNQTILLVDNDRELLLSLKESLSSRGQPASVLLAGDGAEALQMLRHQPISLMVTMPKPPRIDGFELLSIVNKRYPDVPVILIAGTSTPDMEHLARQAGAAGFMVTPFAIDRLADLACRLLHKETEGGILHQISSVTFLQLVEMEQKTCTVRLEEKATGKRGVFFFVEGALCDARQGDLKGREAAYEIFGWDPVSLWIQNDSSVRQNRIQKDVHLLLLESARRRDESQSPEASFAEESEPSDEERLAAQLNHLRAKLEQGIGPGGGVERVFIRDPFWNERYQRTAEHGRKLNLGDLVVGYFDPGDSHGYLMMEGKVPAVVVVNRKCPRDKLIKIFID
jgi:CheY-like chemotaxis protein